MWQDLIDTVAELIFEQVPFSHPIWVVYSSGTTGLPKPLVHSHGGILVEFFKFLNLHMDLKPTDRFFWFSTTGWVMWNIMQGGGIILGRSDSTINRYGVRMGSSEIYAAVEVPTTLNGKKLEVPVKKILSGTPLEDAVNLDSMSNPQAMDYFAALAASG